MRVFSLLSHQAMMLISHQGETQKHQKKRKILEELLGCTRGKKLRRQVKARYECARWLQPTSKSHFLAFRKKNAVSSWTS